MCSVRNDIGITSMRLIPLRAIFSMVLVRDGCSHFCGPTLLWKQRTCGLGQAPSWRNDLHRLLDLPRIRIALFYETTSEARAR